MQAELILRGNFWKLKTIEGSVKIISLRILTNKLYGFKLNLTVLERKIIANL